MLPTTTSLALALSLAVLTPAHAATSGGLSRDVLTAGAGDLAISCTAGIAFDGGCRRDGWFEATFSGGSEDWLGYVAVEHPTHGRTEVALLRSDPLRERHVSITLITDASWRFVGPTHEGYTLLGVADQHVLFDDQTGEVNVVFEGHLYNQSTGLFGGVTTETTFMESFLVPAAATSAHDDRSDCDVKADVAERQAKRTCLNGLADTKFRWLHDDAAWPAQVSSEFRGALLIDWIADMWMGLGEIRGENETTVDTKLTSDVEHYDRQANGHCDEVAADAHDLRLLDCRAEEDEEAAPVIEDELEEREEPAIIEDEAGGAANPFNDYTEASQDDDDPVDREDMAYTEHVTPDGCIIWIYEDGAVYYNGGFLTDDYADPDVIWTSYPDGSAQVTVRAYQGSH